MAELKADGSCIFNQREISELDLPANQQIPVKAPREVKTGKPTNE